MWTEKQIVDVFLLANSFSDVDKYPGCFGFPLSRNKHYKNEWSIQKVAAAASPSRFLHIWWIFYSQIYFVDCALM